MVGPWLAESARNLAEVLRAAGPDTSIWRIPARSPGIEILGDQQLLLDFWLERAGFGND